MNRVMDGDRRLKRRQITNDDIDFANINSKTPYGVPIYDMLRALENSVSKESSDVISSSETAGPSLANSQLSQTKSHNKRRKVVPSVLLTEKYRPRNFFDLLGNDDANRQILRYLSYWKSVVFGTEPTLNDFTDSLGRPLRKIILVNGPPGVGKTTAAHVIANQAGFDVMEINASDERSASVVTSRIGIAVTSHQVNSKRPVCIVADEVEGAAENGFVKALVTLIKNDSEALALQNKPITPGRKNANRGKNVKQLMRRPIIAICNNVWSSSLRPLRQYAEIVYFNPPSNSRVVKRLESVCLNEKLFVGNRQLAQLVEHCNGDLRACLNSLQFRPDQYCGNSRNSIGVADSSFNDSAELVDATALVKRQFLHPKPATFGELESCSDLDRLINSCFTAYHDVTYIDDRLKKPSALGELLALTDARHSTDEIRAFVVHAFGQLFRSPALAAQKQPTVWKKGVFGRPPSYYEKTKQTEALVKDFRSGLATEVARENVSSRMLMMDLMPFALQISNPVVRPLLRPEDKTRLMTAAQALSEMGIRIRTDKLEDGSFVHRLDPHIELATVINEYQQDEASAGSYIARGHLKSAMKEIVPVSRGQWYKSSTSSATKALQNAIVTSKPKNKVFEFLKTSDPTASQAAIAEELKVSKIWVQYNEGFSNAVRKPISWGELFGL